MATQAPPLESPLLVLLQTCFDAHDMEHRPQPFISICSVEKIMQKVS